MLILFLYTKTTGWYLFYKFVRFFLFLYTKTKEEERIDSDFRLIQKESILFVFVYKKSRFASFCFCKQKESILSSFVFVYKNNQRALTEGCFCIQKQGAPPNTSPLFLYTKRVVSLLLPKSLFKPELRERRNQ